MGQVYLPLGMGQNFSGACFYYRPNEIFAAVQRVMLPLEIALVHLEYENRLFHLVSWYVAKNSLNCTGHGYRVFICLQLLMCILHRSDLRHRLLLWSHGHCSQHSRHTAHAAARRTHAQLQQHSRVLQDQLHFVDETNLFREQVDAIPCDATENCSGFSGTYVLSNYSVLSRPVLVGALLLLLLLNVGYRAIGFLTLWINMHSRK